MKKAHNCLFTSIIYITILALFIGIIYIDTLIDIDVIIYESAYFAITGLIFLFSSIYFKSTFPLIGLLMGTQVAHFGLFKDVNEYIEYIFFGIIVISFVIHFIKFKPKFRLGSFFIPLTILLVILSINSTRLIKSSYSTLSQIINYAFALISYIFFASTIDNPTMNEIKTLVCGYIFTFCLMEVFINTILSSDKIESYIYDTELATMLLLIIPFVLTSFFNVNNIKKFLGAIFGLIIFGLISYIIVLGPIINIIIIILEIIAMIILGIKKSNKVGISIIFLVFCIPFLLALTYFSKDIKDINVYIIDLKNEVKIYFNTLQDIQKYINAYKESDFSRDTLKDIFGLIPNILFNSGLLGLLGYVVFTFFKYIKLCKARTTASITLVIGLLASGIILLTIPSFYMFKFYLILNIFILCILEYKVNGRLLCEYGEDND